MNKIGKRDPNKKRWIETRISFSNGQSVAWEPTDEKRDYNRIYNIVVTIPVFGKKSIIIKEETLMGPSVVNAQSLLRNRIIF